MTYRLADGTPLEISGASYAGRPLSHTVMFVSKKVESLLVNLSNVIGCLVFIESNVTIPDNVDQSQNCFIRTDNPQREYACFANEIADERERRNRARTVKLTPLGYYIGENVTIGDGSFIEPGVVIGHDVIIGRNARIMAGAVIKHAEIGDNFYAGENVVIGTEGFNFAVDSDGHAFRMKALGQIRIGDNVEIGAQSVVACALAGCTEIGSYTKIDTYSQVSHDCTVGSNCEICGGVMLGGFVKIGERVFVGANVATKNRISIGDDAFIALGSTVLKNVEKGEQVFGNPARVIRK